MIAIFLLTACGPDESISGYADTTLEYRLTEIDGVPFTARATISFPEQGLVSGQAPCNSYLGEQTEYYPWFGISGINATRMACPDMGAETQFFAALNVMTLSEVVDTTLILSNTDGNEMVFIAR